MMLTYRISLEKFKINKFGPKRSIDKIGKNMIMVKDFVIWFRIAEYILYF